jgi:hypothetical protein
VRAGVRWGHDQDGDATASERAPSALERTRVLAIAEASAIAR